MTGRARPRAGDPAATATPRTGAWPGAVIFDMDGVLTDSEPLHAQATVDLLAVRGITYVPGEDDFFGKTGSEVFLTLKARYGLSDDTRQLEHEWVRLVITSMPERLRPLPGVPAVLHQLRAAGHRLALASGSSRAIIAATLSALDLDRLFDPIVSAGEVGRGKPHPDVFLETARRLGVPARSCLAIEDSRNGLLAAISAGMACVAIPCASTASQDFSGAAARLGTLGELPAWLDLASLGGAAPRELPSGGRP